MENPQKQQVAERVKQANNILVTVSNNPSVDQLAACIGLTLALNKLGKHATAVFSGAVPSTIEFLQPEKTIEKNTDSLRDFIIALDKAKADKLRYKVEDKVVKIFITPYRTSINEKDLQFSQGDFNVDVVLAIGVHNQHELDQAITSHGRILHDATVATMNNKPGGELGGINWLDQRASSLCELVVQLIDVIDKKVIDSQMATALLTGIVAETHRFSNNKTPPLTMSYSAELMTAGANQQLVATKLEERPKPPPPPPQPVQQQPQAPPQQPPQPPKTDTEGTLQIPHETEQQPIAQQQPTDQEQPLAPQINIDDEGRLQRVEAESAGAAPSSGQPQPQPQAPQPEPAVPPEQPQQPPEEHKEASNTDPTSHMASSHKVLQPPTLNDHRDTSSEDDESSAGSPASSANEHILRHTPPPFTSASSGQAQPQPPGQQAPGQPPADDSGGPGRTLTDLEQAVDSPHVSQPGYGSANQYGQGEQMPAGGSQPDLSGARNAVTQAANDQSAAQGALDPIAALNAQPLGQGLHDNGAAQGPNDTTQQPPSNTPPQNQGGGQTLPPPAPPPMMPPSQ